MQNNTEEQELVERLRRRDPAALKFLLDNYKNKVANICYRFLFNREDAEEIAQEVFISVYKAIPSFRGDAKLSTWIYQIASTKSLDLIRSRKRKKRFGHVKSLLGIMDEGRQIADPQSSNPVENMENEEKGRIIREAIDTLPEKYRRAFTLSKCDGLGHKEVAGIMGISVPSAETLVHRAKKKLRELLFVSFQQELKKNPKNVQRKAGKSVSKHVSPKNVNLFVLAVINIIILYLFKMR
ncbi:MAG: RNA polymerase sigma factor [bacterium]|nr:RNA polymerase sigma factor [bacterium]